MFTDKNPPAPGSDPPATDTITASADAAPSAARRGIRAQGLAALRCVQRCLLRMLGRREDDQVTKQRLELALEGGRIGTYEFCMPSGQAQVDVRMLAMLGYGPDAKPIDVGAYRELIHQEDRAQTDRVMQGLLAGERDELQVDYRVRHRDGHWIWLRDTAKVYQRDRATGELCVAGAVVDITAQRTAEIKLRTLAYQDELTGLLNRRGTWDALERLHAYAQRNRQRYAIGLLDLDHFKYVNDLFGHPIGDQVLAEVAQRLVHALRRSDWLGRWGGEEVLVMLPSSDIAPAKEALERLRRVVADTAIATTSGPITVTLSGGYSVADAEQSDLKQVLASADAALYAAKEQGRNRILFSGDPAAEREVSIAVRLRDAVHTASLRSAYQPLISLRDGARMGYAMLARIGAEGREPLPAATFLEVARQLGLMHKVDYALLMRLIRALRGGTRLPVQSGGKRPLCFAYLSGDLLNHPTLIADLADGLAALADPHDGRSPVVFTLAEAQIGSRTADVADALRPLLEVGGRLALAGCGGESGSLQLLAGLPIDFIELDGALLRQSKTSAHARSVLRGLQQTARDLGQITIANRIEDEATRDWLRELGIDWGLGYLFGPPEDLDAD